MAIALFDDRPRSDKGPAAYSESDFAYLNRSARNDVVLIRSVLEEWVGRYPAEHRAELITRFRSDDGWQHQSAVFELFLYELLTRLGCRPVIHGETAGGRRPDFHLTDSENRQTILEATLVTGESKTDQGARQRLRAVYDAINRIDSPNFFVGAEVRQHSDRPVPGRRLIAFLEQRLQAEDPACGKSLEWTFSADGWEISLRALPKFPANRGRPGIRPLGYQFSGPQYIDSWTPLRDAIRHKAGRYGAFDVPYVIALNLVADWPPDDIDIGQALFGEETFTFRTGGGEPVFGRKTDGAWIGPTGPRNTRNSAVLLVYGLRAWTLASVTATLYHHPWAQRRYEGPLSRLRRMSADGDHLVAHEGEPVYRLLDLPEGWPGPRDIQR